MKKYLLKIVIISCLKYHDRLTAYTIEFSCQSAGFLSAGFLIVIRIIDISKRIFFLDTTSVGVICFIRYQK